MSTKSAAFGKIASALCCGSERPRERILKTACELFYKHGIRGIGVDAIAEAAGTNKMTLYRHFGSKDDLIIECLKQVADDGFAKWRKLEEGYPGDPMAQLHAWVRWTADWLISDSRGCALANAAIELSEDGHPARRIIEQYKRAHRERLVNLCGAAGIADADLLADTLSLLIEGARVSRQSVGAEGPSAKLMRMSEAVIASFATR